MQSYKYFGRQKNGNYPPAVWGVEKNFCSVVVWIVLVVIVVIVY